MLFFCLLFSPASVFMSQSFPISPFLPLRRGVFFFKRRWRGRTMGEHCPCLTVTCGIIAVYLGLGSCVMKSSLNSKSLCAAASKTLPWAARTMAHHRKHPPILDKAFIENLKEHSADLLGTREGAFVANCGYFASIKNTWGKKYKSGRGETVGTDFWRNSPCCSAPTLPNCL